jgi:hypothetical protein
MIKDYECCVDRLRNISLMLPSIAMSETRGGGKPPPHIPVSVKMITEYE